MPREINDFYNGSKSHNGQSRVTITWLQHCPDLRSFDMVLPLVFAVLAHNTLSLHQYVDTTGSGPNNRTGCAVPNTSKRPFLLPVLCEATALRTDWSHSSVSECDLLYRKLKEGPLVLHFL